MNAHFSMIRRAVFVALCAWPVLTRALTPSDLGWDLTYQTVWASAARPGTSTPADTVAQWLQQHPRRFIHERLEAWPERPRIRASVLVEMPPGNGRRDGADTWWLVRTADGAQRCAEMSANATAPCEPFDAGEADALIQTLSNLPPAQDRSDLPPVAFVSVRQNGRVQQVALTLADLTTQSPGAKASDAEGPWRDAMKVLSLSAAQLRPYKASQLALQQAAAVQQATAQGDAKALEALLEAQARLDPATAAATAQTAMAQALAARQNTLLPLLARHDPKFSTRGAQWLTTAVLSQNAEAVIWLVNTQGVPLNRLTPSCDSALLLADKRQLPDMARLLIDLGADATWHRSCPRIVAMGRQNSANDEEEMLAQAYGQRIRDSLEKRQFADLSRWHAQLVSRQERTQSGLWKLGTYHTQMARWFRSTKDPAYWDQMNKLWEAWMGTPPMASPAARLFGIQMGYQKAWAYRGSSVAKDVPRADMSTYQDAASLADQRLLVDMQLTSRPHNGDLRAEPEAYQFMVEFAQFSPCGSCARFRQTPEMWDRVDTTVPSELRGHPDRNTVWWSARLAMAKFPTYHPAFFSAAHYLRPEWGGSFAMIDDMAREATRASQQAEGKAMYARIQWALSDAFPGALFQRTKASWPDMKAGFEDMVRQYPAPRNLNAYASFACEARDFATMRQVLQMIGDQVEFSMWRGADRFFECAQP